MHTMTVRRSGDTNSLTVRTSDGPKNTWEFPGLSRLKQMGVNETIVNMWCASNGHPPMYDQKG